MESNCVGGSVTIPSSFASPAKVEDSSNVEFEVGSTRDRKPHGLPLTVIRGRGVDPKSFFPASGKNKPGDGPGV